MLTQKKGNSFFSNIDLAAGRNKFIDLTESDVTTRAIVTSTRKQRDCNKKPILYA